MANPGSLRPVENGIIGSAPFTLVPASAAVVSRLDLNANLSYTLAHDGETPQGNAATNTIYFTFDVGSGNYTTLTTLPNFTPTPSESLYPKLKLLSGRSVAIGPGIPSLYYTISGNSSTPTFTIVPGTNAFGKLY